MSEYNAPPPPPDPYGQQPNAYGQPAYGQQGYGQSGYGQQGLGMRPDYAGWGKRAGALIIDQLITAVVFIPAIIGFVMVASGAETTTVNGVTTVENNDIGGASLLLIVLGYLLVLAFSIWNYFIKQGRTGYTVGKGVLGIKLIGEQTGTPIGAGKAFVRQICHILDSFCYIGYLWPIWDSKKQTFADKIMTSIVVNQPKG